jgi:hypothetical protein
VGEADLHTAAREHLAAWDDEDATVDALDATAEALRAALAAAAEPRCCEHPLDEHSYQSNPEADPTHEPPWCDHKFCQCPGWGMTTGPAPDPQGADEPTPDAIGQAAARYADHIAAGTWPFQSCPEFRSAPGQGGHPCPGCPLPSERTTFEAARRAAAVGAPDEPTDDDLTELREALAAPAPNDMRISAVARRVLPGLLAEVERLRAIRLDSVMAFGKERSARFKLAEKLRDARAEVERLRAAASSPPPTPAPTREQVAEAVHDELMGKRPTPITYEGRREAAIDRVMALIAQPDREPLWRGKTVAPAPSHRSYLPDTVPSLPVPPGTAVRVDEDTGQ